MRPWGWWWWWWWWVAAEPMQHRSEEHRHQTAPTSSRSTPMFAGPGVAPLQIKCAMRALPVPFSRGMYIGNKE